FRAMQDAHCKLGNIFTTYRDNIDGDKESYGCHESYQILRETPWEKIRRNLTPFLISRAILFGAGMIWPDGRFTYSARAELTDTLEAERTTKGSRAVLGSRDESHLPEKLDRKYRRLHLTSGDTNVCQQATVNKLSITALVLSMVEAGVDLSSRYPRNPVTAMKRLNANVLGTNYMKSVSKKMVNAWDIQRYICDQAIVFVEWAASHNEVPEWVMPTLRRWDRLLTDLKTHNPDDWSSSAREIDWWAKWHLLQLYKAENPKAGWEELFSVSLQYHNIDPNESLAYGMINDGMLARCFSDQQLENSVTVPPNHIRAQQRGEVVQQIVGGNRQIRDLGWESFMVAGKEEYFDFPEPELWRVREKLRNL
ncbi:proteasome accessory factor PafA2 family protein, partial [Patescibacteria group bacterium]|nr:proteasome accessory factor PafA2 family protein [Patescibacteria group bacterium]